MAATKSAVDAPIYWFKDSAVVRLAGAVTGHGDMTNMLRRAARVDPATGVDALYLVTMMPLRALVKERPAPPG